MARRTEQTEQTRQRLLASAREVFEAHGFERANLRLIAQKAEIAPGTIFVHFQNKHDLLHAALFEDLSSVLRSALTEPSADSLEAWLARLTDRMLCYYESRPVLSRILLQESLLADPPWAERFASQIAEVHAAVVREAERDRERGKLRPGANLPLFAASYLSFYMFALIAWAQGTHPDPRQLVKHLTAQQLLAIQVPSTTSHEKGEFDDYL